MKRRSLFSLLVASSAGAALAGGRWSSGGAGSPRSRSVLVLLELRGGNDGLNTLAPIADPLYRQARPTLALDGREALPLAAGLALHPALAPLLPLWQSQRLAFALGVGWPRPNRSHFKAADQWATASSSGEGVGWLAAALDQRQHPGPLLALGPAGCPALEGGEALALQLSPAELRGRPNASFDPAEAGANAVLRQMLALEQAGAQQLQRLPSRASVTLLAVSEFGRRLRENGSRGTDHGSASVALLFGAQLPSRLIGKYPSLSDLDERGGLIPSLSPPELYRQVLQVARV